MWPFGKESKSLSDEKLQSLNWNLLEEEFQFDEVLEHSMDKTVVIFKHSTRCNISAMAKNRLKSLNVSEHENLKFYYVDLIAHRNVSNLIASELDVKHESPQIIILKNGKVDTVSNHGSINPDVILQRLS